MIEAGHDAIRTAELTEANDAAILRLCETIADRDALAHRLTDLDDEEDTTVDRVVLSAASAVWASCRSLLDRLASLPPGGWTAETRREAMLATWEEEPAVA